MLTAPHRFPAPRRTILRLLARLYLPSHGAILLDGVNINEVAMHNVVAMVQQETIMFEMSIEDNIRIACQRAHHPVRHGAKLPRLPLAACLRLRVFASP